MAFLQSVSVLQAAANMPGLAPGAAAGTVSDAGLTRAKPGNIGAGNAGEPGTQSSTLRIIGK
jgi:hypothetical protein